MKKPKISIIMGSKSDWPTMQHTSEMLNELDIEHDVKVVSAHRTPDLLYSFAESARKKGIEIITNDGVSNKNHKGGWSLLNGSKNIIESFQNN